MVGLTTAGNVSALMAAAPGSNAIYTFLSYAWYMTGGLWQIYESGSLVGSYGALSTTDVPVVAYDGSNIVYYLNGNVERTVAIAGLTLFGAVALNDLYGINSLDFSPGTFIPLIDTEQIGPNAATDIYTAALPGPTTTPFQSGVFTGVTVVVPSVPYAHTAIVTLVCDAWKSSGGGIWIEKDLHGSTSGGITSEERFLTTTASPGERVTVQYEFPNAAGTAYDYNLAFNTLSPSNTITVQNVRIQVEIIKR